MNYPRPEIVDTRNRASRREIQVAQLGAGMRGLGATSSTDWTFNIPLVNNPKLTSELASMSLWDAFGELDFNKQSPAGYGSVSGWLYENRQLIYLGAAAVVGLALVDALS